MVETFDRQVNQGLLFECWRGDYFPILALPAQAMRASTSPHHIHKNFEPSQLGISSNHVSILPSCQWLFARWDHFYGIYPIQIDKMRDGFGGKIQCLIPAVAIHWGWYRKCSIKNEVHFCKKALKTRKIYPTSPLNCTWLWRKIYLYTQHITLMPVKSAGFFCFWHETSVYFWFCSSKCS